LFLFFALETTAQNLIIHFSSKIKELDVKKLVVKIRVNGAPEWQECNTAKIINDEIQSPCFIGQRIETIRVQFEYDGRGKTSLVFDSTKINNESDLKIGFINLIPTGAIKIINIVAGHMEGFRTFNLIAENPLHDNAFITRIQVRAQNNYDHGSYFGDFSDSIIFTIQPKLSIESFNNNIAKGHTSYIKLLDKKIDNIFVICDVGFNQKLIYDYLNLNIPCNLVIVSKGDKGINIKIPDTFESQFDSSLKQYAKLMRIGKLSDFKSFLFTLTYLSSKGIGNTSKEYP
jgi:hypothetical protein